MSNIKSLERVQQEANNPSIPKLNYERLPVGFEESISVIKFDTTPMKIHSFIHSILKTQYSPLIVVHEFHIIGVRYIHDGQDPFERLREKAAIYYKICEYIHTFNQIILLSDNNFHDAYYTSKESFQTTIIELQKAAIYQANEFEIARKAITRRPEDIPQIMINPLDYSGLSSNFESSLNELHFDTEAQKVHRIIQSYLLDKSHLTNIIYDFPVKEAKYGDDTYVRLRHKAAIYNRIFFYINELNRVAFLTDREFDKAKYDSKEKVNSSIQELFKVANWYKGEFDKAKSEYLKVGKVFNW